MGVSRHHERTEPIHSPRCSACECSSETAAQYELLWKCEQPTHTHISHSSQNNQCADPSKRQNVEKLMFGTVQETNERTRARIRAALEHEDVVCEIRMRCCLRSHPCDSLWST